MEGETGARVARMVARVAGASVAGAEGRGQCRGGEAMEAMMEEMAGAGAGAERDKPRDLQDTSMVSE